MPRSVILKLQTMFFVGLLKKATSRLSPTLLPLLMLMSIPRTMKDRQHCTLLAHALLPPRTFPNDLTNEQLVMMLTNHPILMGMDYHHDIQRLKEAKLGGKELLNLDKESAEQFGLTAEFQIPLMKFIEDLKQYQQTLKSKIQPKSLTSEEATSDERADTEFSLAQSTETIKTETEETDTSQSTSAQPPELDMWKLPGVDECDETSVVISSSQGQLVNWNGLKLHIHAGSLPEGVDQCTIYIKASLAGAYEIPENSSLVSAIFWLRCEPQCTFIKPITVEIQHCSTKQDLSKLKIVRAYCNQEQLPYKFKQLGGRFNADTSYGAIEVKRFSGVGVTEEGPVSEEPVSERLYYNQLFYYNNQGHQQRHDIHIIYTWNTEAHINYVNKKYPEQQGFYAGCYQVIELDGAMILVDLNKAEWTEVMDGQWEIYPIKPVVTKAELDDFKIGRGIPNCVLEARSICEDCPLLLHGITLSGVKPPYNELTLRLPYSMPSRRDHPMHQPQSPCDIQPQISEFSKDMSNEQLAVWLRNHPNLTGTNYEEDISKLRGARVNGNGFLSLDEGRLERLGVSLGFLLPLVNIIQDLKTSQQLPGSKKLSSQQQQKQSQVPSGSAVTPTTQYWPTSSATGKQIKSGSAEYDVLIHHTADLQLTLRMDLINLGAQLVSAQIITPDQYDKIRNTHQSVNERVADLVGYVQRKALQNPWYYHAFTGVLRSDRSQYGDILTKLEDSFNSHPLTMAMRQQPVMQLRAQALQITEHPRSKSCVHDERVDLSVSAIGAEPLLYKWKRNGEDITYPECTGINTPILTIHSFSQDHQGNYSCIVSNSQKSVSSGPANLALVTQKVPSIEQTNTVPVLMPPGQLQPTTLTDHQSQCVIQQPPSIEQTNTVPVPMPPGQPPQATPTDNQTQRGASSQHLQAATQLDEIPTLDKLLILKYMDKGKKKKVRIVSEASHKWKNIANLICDGTNKTTVLEEKCRGDPEECVQQALVDNFINKKPKNYSQDWSGLIELLDDVGLETLAENVKYALLC